MEVSQTPLDDLLRVSIARHEDDRGEFVESWHRDRYYEFGIKDVFVQDNVSTSKPGVLRGLHFRHPESQAQLVTVISGQIFDVCVDLRTNSKTFGRWYGSELVGSRKDQLYMPEGFAHGFCVLGPEHAVIHYKCTKQFDTESECGLHWNDPDIDVKWPEGDWIISERDQAFPKLRDLDQLSF